MVLKGRMTRAVARLLLPDWAKSGWSAARMIRGLKVRELTFKRTDMLGDIRKAQDRVTYTPKVIDFPDTKLPGRDVMNETILLRDRRYKLGFRSKVYYTETGKTTYEWTNFYTDTLDTKEGWADKFLDTMNTKQINKYKQYQATEVTYIEHNQGWTY